MSHVQLEKLAGFNIACQFLYQAFHREPAREFLQTLHNKKLFDHWPVETTNEKVEKGLQKLTQSLESLDEDAFIQLTQDYAALFIGPDALKAAPWGSVYLSEDQMTYGESTQAIRAFYREFGVEMETAENEPEDHIGLTFAFLAYLTEQAITSAECQETLQPWLCATGTFLSDHLLTWAPRFLQIMEANAETGFYQGIALLAEGTLAQLAQLTDADYKIVRLYR